MTHAPISWIAAIAGETEMHLIAMDAADDPAIERQAPPDDWTGAACALCAGAPVPVIACGLPDAGVRKVPCAPLDHGLIARETHGLTLVAIPGLAQDSPAHVTRGAETAIAGFLHLNPEFDGVLCQPGLVTTWAHISAGEVVSFQTAATARIAASVGQGLEAAPGWDDAAFAHGQSDTLARPERLAERLASLRGSALLSGLSEGTLRARLWGTLIGAELAAMRPYWLGQQVAVLGEGDMGQHYVRAIAAQGLPPIEADGPAMLLKGLTEAHRRLTEAA